MTQFSFNPAAFRKENAPLTPGQYNVMISAELVKPTTKNPANYYLELELTVIDGAYRGRRVLDRLNVVNTNKNATTMGLGRLAQILEAIGLPIMTDTQELLNHRLVAVIDIEKNRETGELGDRNEVKGYLVYEQHQTPEVGPGGPAIHLNIPNPAPQVPEPPIGEQAIGQLNQLTGKNVALARSFPTAAIFPDDPL